MPLRPDLLTRRLSTFDLPILPFLAPPIFQPWPPSKARRNFGLHNLWKDHNTLKAKRFFTSTEKQLGISKSRVWDGAQDSPSSGEAKIQDTKLEAEQHSDEPSKGLTDPPDAYEVHTGECISREEEEGIEDYVGEQIGNSSHEIAAVQATKSKLITPRRKSTELLPSRILSLKGWERESKTMAKKRQRRGIRRGKRSVRLVPTLEHPVDSYFGEKSWYQRSPPNPPSFRSFPCSSEMWHWRCYILARAKNRGFFYGRPRQVAYIKPLYPRNRILRYINMESSASLREAWLKLSEKHRARCWPTLMLTTLREYPEKAMKILSATYCDPYPEGRSFAHCINYIIWFYLRPAHRSHDTPVVELFETISRLFLEGPSDHLYLSQASIFLLMEHLRSPDLVAKLYRTMDHVNNPLHVMTLMQFADRLAKAGGIYPDIAYEILDNIGQLHGIDWNRDIWRSLCTTLLMAAGENTKYNHQELFDFMLRSGVEPDVIIFNVMIYKTLQTGDHEKGWKIFNLMQDHEKQPDSFTYSILMNDAKKRIDEDAINFITNAVKERSIWSSHIVADCLHAMFLFQQRRIFLEQRPENTDNSHNPASQPDSFFEKLLPVYCQFYRFEPLAHLVPGLERYYRHITRFDSAPVQNDNLIEPNNPVLVIMISALLRGLDDSETPKIFYEHWRQLVKNNDPQVLEISQRSHDDFRRIYNVTILALGTHVDRLPDCLRVLKDMSAKAPESPDTGYPDIYEPPPLHPPKPDIYTWSILLAIFMRHRQTRAAEKVITKMRELEIEPNDVTWNTLLQGYSNMQETRMSVDVLSRLESAGFKADQYTWSALNTLRDRRALIESMQKLEDDREAEEFERIESRRREIEDNGAPADESKDDEGVSNEKEKEFAVKDMMTKDAYREFNEKNTQWRILKRFQRLDEAARRMDEAAPQFE